MIKHENNGWDKFFDPKRVKKNLIDASVFLSFYELLNNAIIERIKEFFNNEFKDGEFVTSMKYKEEIIERKIEKRGNIFLASCNWLVDNEVISNDEKALIINIKEERNRIAHNLPKYLFEDGYEINKDLFESIQKLIIKIEKWWIINVELPTNPDIINKDIDIDSVVPGHEFILNYIFNIANTDLDEMERDFEKI